MKIVRKILMFVFVPLLFVAATLKALGKTKKYAGELLPGVWHRVYPPGLVDSRGKATHFFACKGSVDKLVVYFCGGGVSWSEESAAKPMSVGLMMLSITSYYSPKVYKFVATLFKGVLSQLPENPFGGWNKVFIPYVTGDFHLGNNEYKYKNGRKTLYHVGERNARLIMEECKKLFPGAEALLVCGESAGAFGAAGSAPLVAGHYPDIPVHIYSDGSQLVAPLWRRTARDVWGVDEKLLDKIEEGGDLYYNLVEHAAAQLGDRAVFLRSDTYYDAVLIEFSSTLHGGPHEATPEAVKNFHGNLAATEKRLKESGLPYYSFTSSYNKNPKTGLTQHTLCHDEKAFHNADDFGVSLASWLYDAVSGNPRDLGRDELLGA